VLSDLAAQRLGRLVSLPHRRQIVGGQQLGQHPGVDLVGLDLRLGDHPGLERVRHHHLPGPLGQQPGDRRGIHGGLQRHPIRPAQCRGELAEPLRRGRHPAGVSDPAVLPDGHLREGLGARPARYTCPWSPSSNSPRLNGEPTGETTTTDSRSQRTRTSRRGGHLLTRALSPSNRPACPICVSPGHPLFRMVAPYFADRSPHPGMPDDRGTSERPDSFIPDTN
jgi:hypothetical protein